ncbi:hypothetical protein C5167_007807 [Papaver somniferum]|nr:hypothetical protein C5167_007807 [Papaver somniferum]
MFLYSGFFVVPYPYEYAGGPNGPYKGNFSVLYAMQNQHKGEQGQNSNSFRYFWSHLLSYHDPTETRWCIMMQLRKARTRNRRLGRDLEWNFEGKDGFTYSATCTLTL